jgi:osmoprotectant transport system permease protein
VVLTATGILQTVPSLALLLFMIPAMSCLTGEGTGAPPAIATSFCYSLLPIVRNTYTGLAGIPHELRESAAALGLPPIAFVIEWLLGLLERVKTCNR